MGLIRELLHRLEVERRNWKRALKRSPSDEVKWIMEGINIAAVHARNIHTEQRALNAKRYPRLNSKQLGRIAQAAQTALNYLNRADKTNAIKTLEKAVNRINLEGYRNVP